MKIIHVVESFGGGVLDFLRVLIENTPDHHHIIIHGLRQDTPEDYAFLFPKNVDFIYWKNAQREINLLKDIKALTELLRLLKRVKEFDVIHLHSSKAGLIGRIAARLLGKHHITLYTTHGISFLRKDISNRKKSLFILAEKIGSRIGGKVIACSKSEADLIKSYGINSTYIYNGIDCPHDTEITKEKEEKSKNNKNNIIIGTAGRITTQKNPKLFNEIANELLQHKNVKFIWIGDGELRNQLNSPNIIVTGWKSGNEYISLLNSIDIYISTSLWEGLPLSVLQAMCAGKPLILSKCTGNIDLVIDEHNGIIFSKKDQAIQKILHFINNPNKRSKAGLESRKLVIKSFSAKKMITEYLSFYQNICK